MSVTVHLHGGICNQAAMYSTALALSRKLGTDLKLDISQFDWPYEPRMYSLGQFKGVTQPIVKEMSGKIIKERTLRYDPEIFADAPQDCSIVGDCWQAYKYFEHLRPELAKIFTPREPLTDFHRSVEIAIKSVGWRSVFVTVRRTDYINNGFYSSLGMGYYNQAANYIAREMARYHMKPSYFIFSDEPEWCKENFRIDENQIICGNYRRTVKPLLGREDAELALMRMCSHAIMANSSYSFHGAFFGADMNDGGIVVMPKEWFGPLCKDSAEDFCLPHWVRI